MTYKSLVVVEGPTDEAFVGRILRKRFGFSLCLKLESLDGFWQPTVPKVFPHLGDLKRRVPVPGFYEGPNVSAAVVSAGNVERVCEVLADTLAVLTDPDIAVAIMVDADDEAPAARAERIAEQLRTQGIAWPSKVPGVVDPATSRGTFVFPDNLIHGVIEDLLLESGKSTYRDAIDSATQWVASAAASLPPGELKEFRKPAGAKKAILGAVANVLGPGKSFAMSIENNRWVGTETDDTEQLRSVVDFIGKVVLPETAPSQDSGNRSSLE